MRATGVRARDGFRLSSEVIYRFAGWKMVWGVVVLLDIVFGWIYLNAEKILNVFKLKPGQRVPNLVFICYLKEILNCWRGLLILLKVAKLFFLNNPRLGIGKKQYVEVEGRKNESVNKELK